MDPLSISKPELKKLYRHLDEIFAGQGGGRAGLERILRDFYARMKKDILIGFFFDGRDTDEIASRQRDFLLRAMGATTSFSGKAPADAHKELPPILAGHFDRRLRLLEETLADYGLGAEDIRTWVAFENAFREGIVQEAGIRRNPRA